MSAGRILIVDDDPQIRRTMRVSLIARGYEVGDAKGGEEALERLHTEKYDLVLLDMKMPGMTGLETCRQMRPRIELGIIMLTVRNTEKDKVEALEAGADDYVTKPFSMPELVARIRASLRRLPPSPENCGVQQLYLDGVEINFAARQVKVRGGTLHLTPKEYELLSYLSAHPNRTISHRELLQAIWGPDYGDELEYLRVFMNRLRRKIEPDPSKPQFLLTDAWAGYRFNVPENQVDLAAQREQPAR